MNGIVEMPPAASVYAHHVDTLFWSMTAVTGTVALGVIILMVTFCIRYRKAARSDRTLDETPAGKHRQHLLEIAWITIPLLIFVVFFVWAAKLYFDYEVSPEHPLEIYVVAKQWMWKLEHPNGRREINELHVPRGRVIKLVMTSQDVIHSFYMPAFRIKRDVVPGQFATVWFAPTSAGDYHLFCAEYCGTDHSRMGGRIIVMEPEMYARWLAAGGRESSLAARGAADFRAFGCSGCHDAHSRIHAPDLANLYGRTVPLASGRFVTVDERYVRDSILQPSRDIAAGYADDMPSFAGRVSEEQLVELIAYIKSLAGAGSTDQKGEPSGE
jgi:cytochrome c oxidase subunit 2